ncbi:MAG: GDP-mannose 4,6-dehydratase [Alphaproteobacteria bacterium]
MNKKIAILGSNSFAGACLVARSLREGFSVLGVNRSSEGHQIFLPYKQEKNRHQYCFLKADINENFEKITTEFENFKPNFIVDLAGQGMVAESWNQPEQWYTTNIVAKARLHNWLSQKDWLDRYLRVSTPEVYGSTDALISENWSCAPTTPYAVSHAATDLSLRAFYQHYRFPAMIARFANFYGPAQQLYRIVPRTIIYALTQQRLQLHGGGKSIRAFIFGEDVAEAILCTLSKGTVGEIYHFSPNKFYTIFDVVKFISERLNIPMDNFVDIAPDRPSKDQAYLMSSSRARSELGWTDNTSFETGIDYTINWVRANLSEIRKLPQNYVHKV